MQNSNHSLYSSLTGNLYSSYYFTNIICQFPLNRAGKSDMNNKYLAIANVVLIFSHLFLVLCVAVCRRGHHINQRLFWCASGTICFARYYVMWNIWLWKHHAQDHAWQTSNLSLPRRSTVWKTKEQYTFKKFTKGNLINIT